MITFNPLKYVVCALILCMCFPIVEVGLILRGIHKGQTITVKVELPQITPLITNANGVLGVIRDASQKQADYYDPKKPGGATQQIDRLIVDAKSLIGRTDLNLNGGPGGVGVLPNVSAALESSTRLTQRATADLDDTTASVQPILLKLSKTTDVLVTDIPPIMSDIKDSTGHMAAASKSGASAMKHVDATTGDFQQVADKFRDDYMKPANRLWLYVKTLLGITANSRQALAK